MKLSSPRFATALVVLSIAGVSIPAVASAGGRKPSGPTITITVPIGAGHPGAGSGGKGKGSGSTGSGSTGSSQTTGTRPVNGEGKAYGQSIRAINQTFSEAIKKAAADLVAALHAATTSSERVAATAAFKLAVSNAHAARKTAITSLKSTSTTTTTSPTTTTTSPTTTTTSPTTTTTSPTTTTTL